MNIEKEKRAMNTITGSAAYMTAPTRHDLIETMHQVRDAVSRDTSLDTVQVKAFLKRSKFDESAIKRGDEYDDLARIQDEVTQKADKLYSRSQSIGLSSIFFGPIFGPALTAIAGIQCLPLAVGIVASGVFGGFGLGMYLENRARDMWKTPGHLSNWADVARQLHNNPGAQIDTREALRLS
jgi:hypothetical protein